MLHSGAYKETNSEAKFLLSSQPSPYILPHGHSIEGLIQSMLDVCINRHVLYLYVHIHTYM